MGGSLTARLLRGERPLYAILFVVSAVFTIWPLWAGAVLPFQDYAGNMSYAAILAESGYVESLIGTTYEVGGLFFQIGHSIVVPTIAEPEERDDTHDLNDLLLAEMLPERVEMVRGGCVRHQGSVAGEPEG